ncbi:MAG: hypothetical protein DKM50_03350 [Candidatus Margulisiibacteriota bacterium]|nr:MAG: hypothetical protein A2X43_09490 [Candidatus Margulisbacteria bacterium GWD2_39_127]OGI02878.1 MAG: hypothetical protein A2X42_02275 [Candidatus Margulisbacteria bacterium GWF2_38_17]OGI09659.1 MAG: hypothetical protein A2X41_04985 [Candidatus Margulisbacteria bacterium GWE2_39_32]PZM83015.1 MAG: hypothetical protein DKM50_03350 [Candidatus Margulisiibacteriota bacterium]HAR62175.1 hypothetical protein [Candidatus Margulisiibacteriota bacterium]
MPEFSDKYLQFKIHSCYNEIMKKIYILLIMVILSAGDVFAGTYDLSVSIIPRATYFIDSIYDAVQAKQQLDEMASIRIVNNSEADKSFKIRIQVFTSSLGSEPILDATSVPQSFPIQIAAGGSRIIKNTDLEMNNSSQFTHKITNKDMKDRVNSRYGKNILTEYDGMMPPETFVYKIYLFDSNSQDDAALALASTEESIYQPHEKGNIDIITPGEGSIVSIDNPYPTFVWQRLNVRSGVDVKYNIKIWKVKPDENPNIALSGRPILDDTVENSNKYDYPGTAERLEPDTTYVWRIHATDGLGYTIGKVGNSVDSTFKMSPIEPARLSEPTSEISSVPFQMKWSEVAGAAHYDVYIDKDVSFGSSKIFKGVKVTELAQEDATYYLPGTKYYWYVQAYDDSGKKWGKKSETGSFLFNQEIMLKTPVAVTILNVPPEFSWSELSGASSYLLEIDKTELFQKPDAFKCEGTTFTPDNYIFDPEATYFWRVKAIGSNGKQIGSVSQRSFFKMPDLPVPSLISPMDTNVLSDLPEFSFRSVNWADNYIVQISSDIANWTNAIAINTIRAAVQYPENQPALKPGKTYYWRVIPIDEKGKSYSKFSEIGSFRGKEIPKISLISPVNAELESPIVSFIWNGIEGASKYKLLISEDAGLSSAKRFEVNGTSYTLEQKEALKQGTSYYWAVAASDVNGLPYGDTSNPAIFKLVSHDNNSFSGVEMLSPINETLSGVSVTFKWLSIPSVNEYVIAIGKSEDLSDATKYKVNDNSITNEALKLELAMDTQYYWQVQGTGKAGVIGGPSKIGKFRVPMVKLELLSPLNLALDNNDISFSWKEYPGARKYLLQYSNDEKFSTFKEEQCESNKATIKGLEYNKEYFWRVQPLDLKGEPNGAMSVSGKFSIKDNNELEAATPEDIEELILFLKGYVKEISVAELITGFKLKKATLDGTSEISKKSVKDIIKGILKIKSIKVK